MKNLTPQLQITGPSEDTTQLAKPAQLPVLDWRQSPLAILGREDPSINSIINVHAETVDAQVHQLHYYAFGATGLRKFNLNDDVAPEKALTLWSALADYGEKGHTVEMVYRGVEFSYREIPGEPGKYGSMVDLSKTQPVMAFDVARAYFNLLLQSGSSYAARDVRFVLPKAGNSLQFYLTKLVSVRFLQSVAQDLNYFVEKQSNRSLSFRDKDRLVQINKRIMNAQNQWHEEYSPWIKASQDEVVTNPNADLLMFLFQHEAGAPQGLTRDKIRDIHAILHNVNNKICAYIGWLSLIVRRLNSAGPGAVKLDDRIKLRNLASGDTLSSTLNDLAINAITAAKAEMEAEEQMRFGYVGIASGHSSLPNTHLPVRIINKNDGAVLQLTNEIQRDALEHIILNAYGNVRKYGMRHTGDDEFKVVFLRLPDGSVEITMSDKGDGIAPDELDILGLRGVRLSNIGNQNGTGMGVSTIVETVLEQGWGPLWVNTAPGKGLAFRFVIPANQFADDQAPAHDLAATQTQKNIKDGFVILPAYDLLSQ